MGHHNSSESYRGLTTNSKMKLFVVLIALAAAVAAEPGYFGYGYLHQQNWPSVRGPGFEATCHGCRPAPFVYHHLGKRDAEAEAEAEPAYAHHPYAYGRYLGFYGHPYRFVTPGVAAHPGAATSFVARSPQGLHKREAEAEPAYALHPYGGYFGGYYGHPFYRYPAATSYVARSPQGVRGLYHPAYYYGHPGFYRSYGYYY